MASTNKTTHYNLSQYIGSDKPTYLVDYNQDMSKIDTGIYEADAKAVVNATNIGDLTNLTTTDKLSLVNAINEVNSESSSIGDLQDLTTTTKTSVVDAINEVNGKASNVGDLTNLTTTDKTSVVNAVNEVNAKANSIGNLSSLTTGDKTSVVGAINEVNGKVNTIGDLASLNTTDKTNIVDAINEVNDEAVGSNGVTVWKNPNMSSSFGAQTVTLLESINNYDAFEVIYRQSTANPNCLTSGILPATLGAFLQVGGSQNHWRECTINGNQATFNNAANSTGSTSDNGFVIPEYIIFYNVTRFNQI